MDKKFPLKKQLRAGLLLVCALCFSPQGFSASEADREGRLKELKATIEQLKVELQSIKSSRDGLLTDLQSSETKIGELSEKVKKLREQLENKQGQLMQLQSEKEALVRVKKQQLGSVKQHVNAAYRLGQQSSLRMVLNQQDPAQVARNMKYYDRFLAAQAAKINGYISTISRLETIEPDIKTTVQALELDSQSLDARRQALVAQFADRQRTLQKLEATILSKDAELAEKEKNRKTLESLIQRVVMVTGDMKVAVSNRPFKDLKGKLPWPAQGKVLSSFGSSRVENKMQWQGLVIGAEEGTPVYAVHHGRIVFSDYLRGHGLLLIIDHGDGYMSLYAHNQVLYKEIGDWVSAGEQVAAVGQSGGQKSAGLYFELRHLGQPTNPKPWFKKSA